MTASNVFDRNDIRGMFAGDVDAIIAEQLKAERIQVLVNRLNAFTTKCPLRLKVATVNELRALGWGR